MSRWAFPAPAADVEEVEVESEVIRLLALYQPVGSDLRLLCTLLKINNDLERIADCAVNMAERARQLDVSRTGIVAKEIEPIYPLVQQMLRQAVQAYRAEDVDAARQVVSEDETVDALYGQIVRAVVGEASKSPDDVAAYLDLLSVAKNLERIADHATNIAEDVIFLSSGQIVRHQ